MERKEGNNGNLRGANVGVAMRNKKRGIREVRVGRVYNVMGNKKK